MPRRNQPAEKGKRTGQSQKGGEGYQEKIKMMGIPRGKKNYKEKPPGVKMKGGGLERRT